MKRALFVCLLSMMGWGCHVGDPNNIQPLPLSTFFFQKQAFNGAEEGPYQFDIKTGISTKVDFLVKRNIPGILAISPDRKWYATVAPSSQDAEKTSVWKLSVDGEHAVELAYLWEPRPLFPKRPFLWSPDGKRIFFSANYKNESTSELIPARHLFSVSTEKKLSYSSHTVTKELYSIVPAFFSPTSNVLYTFEFILSQPGEPRTARYGAYNAPIGQTPGQVLLTTEEKSFPRHNYRNQQTAWHPRKKGFFFSSVPPPEPNQIEPSILTDLGVLSFYDLEKKEQRSFVQGRFAELRVSPDGDWLLVTIEEKNGGENLALFNVEDLMTGKQTEPKMLTQDGSAMLPYW
ncbi:MAG: PD40 domain-containing protein [Myxococcales bacterium]|nr:PD40 domain-containing protein [Myxococcales bacterium]MCB9643482.1 PD40 domain-containing protein [Myxococcales bacterium]